MGVRQPICRAVAPHRYPFHRSTQFRSTPQASYRSPPHRSTSYRSTPFNNRPVSPASSARLTPDTPVTYLKGVGPARAQALARLGIHVARDLLLHVPHRYEDATAR